MKLFFSENWLGRMATFDYNFHKTAMNMQILLLYFYLYIQICNNFWIRWNCDWKIHHIHVSNDLKKLFVFSHIDIIQLLWLV